MIWYCKKTLYTSNNKHLTIVSNNNSIEFEYGKTYESKLSVSGYDVIGESGISSFFFKSTINNFFMNNVELRKMKISQIKDKIFLKLYGHLDLLDENFNDKFNKIKQANEKYYI